MTDGEALPLAEGPLGGMGDFYVARYGDYLVGMNCAGDRTFPLAMPLAFAGRRLEDLISKRKFRPAKTYTVRPATTVVLCRAR